MNTLTLAGYRASDPPIAGSRPFATEKLYDEWIGLVIQKSAEMADGRIDVIGANRFNGPPEEIVGDDHEAIRQALDALWAEWQDEHAPATSHAESP